MNVINLVPHSINVNGKLIHQMGSPIRIKQSTELVYTINNIPVKLITNSDANSLPPVLEDTIYIVSRFVADVYKDRRGDFVFPYEYTRTPTGKILMCRSLAQFGQVNNG